MNISNLKIFAFAFVLCFMAFGSSLNAQESNESDARSISNFFNLGLNAGVGGDRIHYSVPMAYGKFGPFYVNYSTLFDSYLSYSFNLGVDIVEIDKKNSKSQTCVTFSAGESDFKSLKGSKDVYYNTTVLVGLNRYLNNKNLSYSAKIGFMDYGRGEYVAGRRYWWNSYDFSYKYLPYGELTIGFNLMKHKKTPATLVRPFVEGLNISKTKTKMNNLMAWKPSGKVRKYFNPYMTIGAGGDRIRVYPTLGFEVGSFYFDGISLRVLSNYNIDRAMNLGYNFKGWKWNNSTVTPSISIHRQRRFKTLYGYTTVQGRYSYSRSGTQQSTQNSIFGGISLSPNSMSTALRFQAGLGHFSERNTGIDQFTRLEGDVSSNSKIKPSIGVSLILKMFNNIPE